MYYSINGVRCDNPLTLEENTVLTRDDLMKNLHPVEDMAEKLVANQGKKLKPFKFGRTSGHIPPNTDVIGSGRHSVLRTKSVGTTISSSSRDERQMHVLLGCGACLHGLRRVA